MKRIEGYAENIVKMYGVDSRLQLARFGFIRVTGWKLMEVIKLS